MRVLLLQSFLGRRGVADQLVFPIGLSCIATALANAGHEPWIVDLNVGGDPWARLAAGIDRFKLQPSLDRMNKEISTAEILDTVRAVRAVPGLKASWSFFATPPDTSTTEQLAYLGAYAWIHATLPGRGRMMVGWCRVEERTHFQSIAAEDGVVGAGTELLPDHPEGLEQLFYVAPGFESWSGFWNGFLDAELVVRAAAGKATAPLRRFGFRDLTPRHMRGMDMAATVV